MPIAITGNDGFKRGYSRYIGCSFVAAATFHLLFFVFSPPFVVKPYVLDEGFVPFDPLLPEITVPDEPAPVKSPPVTIEPADECGDVVDVDVPATSFTDFTSFSPPLAAPGSERASELIPFDEQPVLVRSVNPVYPELARQAGIEGDVLISVLVGTDGAVLDASVLRSSVTPAMEKAALDAAMRFRFRPARQGAVPVSVRVAFRITFELH